MPKFNEKEYLAAITEIDELLTDVPEPGTLEYNRLRQLTLFVHDYEQNHPDHRIDDTIDPIGAIKFHMDRLNKSTKELARVLNCNQQQTQDILSKKKKLTEVQIQQLIKWGISKDRLTRK
jgi:antitoxin component HigA of HigAB toxin-antitoxin module